MEILAQSSLLVAFTSFAFGLSSLAKNARNKLYLLFALACLIISGWSLLFFLDWVKPGRGYYGWHLFLNAWLTPATLAFMQSMTRTETRKFPRTLYWISLVLCITLSVALVLGLERIPGIRSIIYFTPSLILFQMFHFLKIDSEIHPIVGIERRILFYAGVSLTLMTCVMDHLPEVWVGVPIFGNLALTALLYFLTQAILQQRMLNLGSLISRFLILVILALLLAAIYSLLAKVWVVRDFALFYLNSFIVSFVLLTLLEPTRKLVRWLTERMMTEKHRTLREEMQRFEKRISQTVDPSKVLAQLEEFMLQLLQPSRVAFYLQSSTSTAFHKMRESGTSTLPVEFPRQHSLLDALERVGGDRNPPPLLLANLESESERLAGREHKAMYETWSQAMKSLDVNILMPLHARGRLLGFILLDVPAPPEEWGDSWSILKEIEPLVDIAAVALGKMEAFAQEREIERLATLGEMAAGLAHEIRNPLGAIKGAAQFLDPTLDRPESRFLQVIIEEVDRLNQVVTQFLDYSKPYPPLRISEVDLNVLGQKTATLLSRIAPPGVDLRFQSSLLKPNVKGDPELIHQVLMNLVQNSYHALAAARGENKEVLISVEAVPHSEGAYLMIAVEDRGPGISRENLEKVFIPFFTTNPAGTGLGLPICQRIVQAHGGRIEVESAPGFRTVFRVILPRIEKGK